MDAFLAQLRILQKKFDELSSDEHKEALAKNCPREDKTRKQKIWVNTAFKGGFAEARYICLKAMAEVVTSMKEASVRRRFEEEVELTLAWEAEKMIVERFTGESSLGALYDEASSSAYDFKVTPVFDEDDDLTWAQSKETGEQPGTHLQPRALNYQAVEYSGESHTEDLQQLALTEAVVIDAAMTNRHEQSTTSSEETMFTTPGKENRFTCATCGYQGNNRKALYRHGVKTQHLLRSPQYSGSKSCELCPFRTNKTFNFNRHMRRFHSEK